ncbi:MAG: aminoglycoside phosphotransferase family protein [Clostridia bacterium]|nr:aminoglycoside phosphotransferase family protein [Clostridia bacterium]
MSREIANRFAIKGEAVYCERYGQGHINETYLVKSSGGADYILQKVNNTVFKDVPGLMNNIASVTKYLGQRDPDPRHTLHLVPTLDGKDYLVDEEGKPWRLYDFVMDSVCLQAAETPEDFYQSAVAFGMFQRQLSEFPADTLVEVIPHFHDTPDRYRIFREAIEKDVCGRKHLVEEEIAFALAREEEAASLMNQLNAGILPLRVTHNDTKLNNVMLDAEKRTPLCVIDLDTVMPGLMAFDFGDSIRFGASTALEDEKDLSKVEMSLDLYETYVKGFVATCGASMTDAEAESLPMGAKLMTLECGVRFLTDFLSGDVYFHIKRPEHNLDRCRTQFKLVADMEKKWTEMHEIVKKVRG